MAKVKIKLKKGDADKAMQNFDAAHISLQDANWDTLTKDEKTEVNRDALLVIFDVVDRLRELSPNNVG